MRTLAFVLLVGCGKEKAVDPPAPVPIDVGIDASVVPPACAAPRAGTNFTLRQIGAISGSALLATAPVNDTRIFVVDKAGPVWIFDETEALFPTPFIDLTDVVSVGGEQGLLGLAFHPQYETNGSFFVYFTQGRFNVVARCSRSVADPNIADAMCVSVLSVPDFASNHNGGMIEFGLDGMLYVGTGDGGGSGDPQRTAQDPNNLLGKMLRIDVDKQDVDKEYGIPADNPFAQSGGAPEVFQLGLRNPWRWSFDRATGDLYIGDVGQNGFEEISVVRAGEQAGVNYGWSEFEGNSCFRQPCTTSGKTFPVDVRSRAQVWSAIVGGQVYRGACFPDFTGTYFYADHQGSHYAMAKLEVDGTFTVTDLVAPQGQPFPRNPASIHADGRGELIVTTTTGGGVYRIEAAP